MQDVKIELKNVERQVSELEVVKKRAEYLTKKRILDAQQEAELKALEKQVKEESSDKQVAPKTK